MCFSWVLLVDSVLYCLFLLYKKKKSSQSVYPLGAGIGKSGFTCSQRLCSSILADHLPIANTERLSSGPIVACCSQDFDLFLQKKDSSWGAASSSFPSRGVPINRNPTLYLTERQKMDAGLKTGKLSFPKTAKKKDTKMHQPKNLCLQSPWASQQSYSKNWWFFPAAMAPSSASQNIDSK